MLTVKTVYAVYSTVITPSLMVFSKLGNMGAKVVLEFQIYSIQTIQTYFLIRISKLSKVSLSILNCPIVREERPARFQVNLILRAPSQTQTKRENQWHQWSAGHFSFLESIQNIKSTVSNFEKEQDIPIFLIVGTLTQKYFNSISRVLSRNVLFSRSVLFKFQPDSFWPEIP